MFEQGNSDTGNGTKPADQEVFNVAFRAPPFWRTHPELWFNQVESQFVLSGIKNPVTKYHCLVANLDCEELALVQDILDPKAEDGYTKLKTRLLSQYTDDQNQKLKILMQGIQLGDKRPSRLLCEMRNLSAGKFPDDVLQAMWLQNLPVNIQQILSISSDSLTKLAEMADAIANVSGFQSQIGEVSTNSKLSETFQTKFDQLEARISRLETKINKFFSTTNYRKTKTSESKLSTPDKNNQMCFYHTKYGNKAHKCISPCSFTKN